MDDYTQKTKGWLEERFIKTDRRGVYRPHQSIYGFSEGRDKDYISKYIRTHQIMKTLSKLKFDSLLDVGAAEGLKAYIVRTLFSVDVKCSDLSEEACKRATEIFNIESKPADVHDLPFKDNEFDVILCSETLEHVMDFKKAINELLRVAGKALIITVPHEPEELIAQYIEDETPHSHIHHFQEDSLDYLKERGFEVHVKRMFSPLLEIPGLVVGGRTMKYHKNFKYPKVAMDIYNSFVPLIRQIIGIRTAIFFIKLDEVLLRLSPSYNAILYLILKDNSIYSKDTHPNFTLHQIINTTVPHFYLKKV
jgi:2-polyprenyl-3-methyl-5-hydroxy-6-metoxy-1,4-benzoquinol methylase